MPKLFSDETGNLELKVRKAVRERYATLAECSEGCCEQPRASGLPEEAATVSAGCGSPLALVTPKPGETVLDLGSGGGIDVFRASKMVGDSGRSIGVDATPEMVWRARETARKHGYTNVDFRLGEIESLPIEPGSVDYVISNCVINLSPDKQKVFDEAYRVLRKGGIFAVADITSEVEIPDEIKEQVEVWSSCVSGAITRKQYAEQLQLAGFKEVEIEMVSNDAGAIESICCCDSKDEANIDQKYGIESSHIIARKQE
jgi:arsenite methyltransferase